MTFDQSKEKKQDVKIQFVTVDPPFDGSRLDNFLIRIFKAVPKSRIYRAIRHGEVRINKKRAKAETRLHAGDSVRLPPLHQEQKVLQGVPVELAARLRQAIFYETEDLMVLNKPTGIAVHAGSGTHFGIIEAMRVMYPHLSLELVHRLDKETSGCLMIAKKRSALKALQQSLQEGNIQKTYCAWVAGHWPKALQRVDMSLKRFDFQGGERRVCVDESGKSSQTLFKPIRYIEQATLLECRLLTGRTHQIRVHTASNRHPILGDEKYGRKEDNARLRAQGIKGMLLHAARLDIDCQTLNLTVTIQVPAPEDFEKLQ